jgi:hypothetical protein
MERVYLKLNRPIPGVDHLKAFDPWKMANTFSTTYDDCQALGLPPLEDFSVEDFDGPPAYREPPAWKKASAGLKVARALIALYEKRIAAGADPQGRRLVVLEEAVEVLKQLANVLEDADVREVRFCFGVKDLPGPGEVVPNNPYEKKPG